MRRRSLEDHLPGFNCGECGYRSCQALARELRRGAKPEECPFLSQERYQENLAAIRQELERLAGEVTSEPIVGVIDGLRADFSLGPLTGEPACREDLFPFDRSVELHPGYLVRYRPLGCPITHFGRVIDVSHGIITVHMVGPLHLLGQEVQYHDLGICMVAAFEGTILVGDVPDVGQTVRFLPHHCMMQKVHSGVVVHSEDRMVRIEGVDLKVF